MFRNTKKLFSLLLVVTMLCSLAVPAFAEDGEGGSPALPTAYLECGNGYPGDTVECSLASDSSILFASMSVTISYDPDKLIPNLDDITAGRVMDDSLVTSEVDPAGKLTITYNGTENIDNFTGGTLFDFSFTIVDTLVAESTVLIRADVQAAPADGDAFPINTPNSSINILEVDDGIYEVVVTSENSSMGHASASHRDAAEGDVITLTASPNKGYRFAGWDSENKKIKFAEAGSRITTFTMIKEDVTIRAKFSKATAATRFDIVRGDFEGGSFSTKVVDRDSIRVASNAAEGSKVLLFATPEAGYYLKGWSAKTYRDEIVDVIEEENSSVAYFIMVDDDVIVTPIFEKCGVDEYSLTIHTEGFGTATSKTRKYYPGALVEIEAFADDEYQFETWTANTEAVEFDRASSAHTTFVMPAEDVVLTASFVTGAEKFRVSFQSVGGGSAATKNGKTEFYEGDKVTIVATARTGYRFYGWSTSTLSGVKFSNENSSTTTFTMPGKDVVITATFVEYGSAGGSTGGTTGGIAGTAGTTDTTGGAQYQIVFNSTGGSNVTTVRVNANSVLAQPAPPTRDGYFFAGWYIDSACTVKYDFTQPVTHHFTLYAKWTDSLSFNDVSSGAWYYQPITYLAQNGVISGLSSTKFGPNMTITRAQVAQILANLSGANLTGYSFVPFEDVLVDAWYYNAVAWAINAGVIQGTSLTTFAPNAPVTRQDLAVLIHRYITNVSGAVLNLSQPEKSFADQSQIASYATAAVTAMQRSEIINGKDGNRFDPRGSATRAEASKMIYQLMLLIG